MLSEQRGTLWQRLTRRITPLSLVIWSSFYLTVVVILLTGGEAMPWRLHEQVTNDITARVAFDIEDKDQTAQERQRKAAEAPDIFVQNPAPLLTIRNRLTELLATAKAAGADKTALKAQLTAKGWSLSDPAIDRLQQYSASPAESNAYDKAATSLVEHLSRKYIVQEPAQPVRQGTPPITVLRSGEPGQTQDIEVVSRALIYVSDPVAVGRVAAEVAKAFPEPLRPAMSDLVVRTLQGSTGKEPVFAPLWRYDPAATLEGIKQAQERVTLRIVHREPGDLLVRANTTLSAAEIELLRREHEAYLKATQTDPRLRQEKMFRELGTVTLVLILTLGIASYTTIYLRRILERPTRTLALAGLMISVILASRLVSTVPEFSVGFLIVAAMLLTIAYTQRFAFGASGTLAMLVTIACNGDFGLFLTLMAGLAVSVFALREVRTRSKIVGVGLMAAVATFVTSVATSGIQGQPLKYVIEHAAAAGGAALFAGFIVQGILPHYERLFGIATSMTLLEWCDASQPLLRRLAQYAPGTYSHSLILSQMCEEAAVAIGGNGLLARVGALYHDIGKTQKPNYFVENQEAQMSRHDRLSPTMSLLIITGHVKDGLEMARAYGLPRVLHQFILEHHGTTVVKYFHHAATEAAAKTATGKHDREVSESEFRYPGPKPHTPESAILMLCDGCEGAVRALSEPTPGRIESTVHQVVMSRLTDGQFDHCDITLKDLRTIEQSIVKSLCAIHHGRIKYPKDTARKSKSEPAERTAGKPGMPSETTPQQAANGSEPPANGSAGPTDGSASAAAASVQATFAGREPQPEVASQA